MKKGLFQRLFSNFWYKAFSLLLAVMIWGMIQGEQVLELDREVQVTFEPEEGYMIRGGTTRAIAATLKGPRLLMLERPPALEATVRVPPLRGKNYRVRLDKEDIRNWNHRLTLTIHDPYLTVFVDRKDTRTVQVKYVPQGTPADGYFIKKTEVVPARVRLTGLKSELMKIREVVTEPVDINGLQENKIVEVPLVTPPGISGGTMSADVVKVSLEVGDSFVNKRYAGIPVEVVGSDFPASFRPRYATIVIQGTPGTLKFVQLNDLKAFVEARGLAPGEYETDIKVKIPPDTVLIESFPEKGKLIVEEKPRPKTSNRVPDEKKTSKQH